MKIEIERCEDDCFMVRIGDRYSNSGLCFDEMLGTVAMELMPKLGRHAHWLKTKEQWDAAAESRRNEAYATKQVFSPVSSEGAE